MGILSIVDAVYIALLSGQRRGDVLALTDNLEGLSLATRLKNGEALRFRQQKIGANVMIYPAPALIERLLKAEERRKHRELVSGVVRLQNNIIIYGSTEMPFNEHTFAHVFSDVRDLAAKDCPSLADKRFQDLRDTAVTWLARAGCTIPEIASITGHSLKSITDKLKHYLDLTG